MLQLVVEHYAVELVYILYFFSGLNVASEVSILYC